MANIVVIDIYCSLFFIMSQINYQEKHKHWKKNMVAENEALRHKQGIQVKAKTVKPTAAGNVLYL